MSKSMPEQAALGRGAGTWPSTSREGEAQRPSIRICRPRPEDYISLDARVSANTVPNTRLELSA
jgi:hypothetical protein